MHSLSVRHECIFCSNWGKGNSATAVKSYLTPNHIAWWAGYLGSRQKLLLRKLLYPSRMRWWWQLQPLMQLLKTCPLPTTGRSEQITDQTGMKDPSHQQRIMTRHNSWGLLQLNSLPLALLSCTHCSCLKHLSFLSASHILESTSWREDLVQENRNFSWLCLYRMNEWTPMFLLLSLCFFTHYPLSFEKPTSSP